VFPSDLPGVNPATLNGMLLYYRLMTKWSGLGDSTELSRAGLSQLGKAHYEERRSLWYNNCRIKSKLNMASRDFTTDT
jgi:hypothetical protein